MKRNGFLTGLSIGLSNGPMLPFALSFGMSFDHTPATILRVGSAVAVLSGLAMGIGGYYSVRQELRELKASRMEKEAASGSIAMTGSGEDDPALDEHAREQEQWSAFLRTHGDAPRSAMSTAVAIFLANAVAGAIPLLPYLFVTVATHALPFTIPLTVVSFIVTAIFEARLKRQAAPGAVLRALAIAGALTAAGYFMVRLLNA